MALLSSKSRGVEGRGGAACGLTSPFPVTCNVPRSVSAHRHMQCMNHVGSLQDQLNDYSFIEDSIAQVGALNTDLFVHYRLPLHKTGRQDAHAVTGSWQSARMDNGGCTDGHFESIYWRTLLVRPSGTPE